MRAIDNLEREIPRDIHTRNFASVNIVDKNWIGGLTKSREILTLSAT